MATAFADDQIITWLHVTLDNFRVGVRVDTELNRDCCRSSIAQDPNKRPPIQLRADAGTAARGRSARGRIAKRFIRHAEDAVAFFDYDLDRRRHAGLKQQFRIGRRNDDIVGFDVLDGLRWANLSHLAGEGPVRDGDDRKCGLVAEIDLADAGLADIGVDMKHAEICRDEEERRF